jgi:hypothetical protein
MLRELRMARHGVCVQAAGMSPLEAILSGPGGPANAKMFGWPEPYPDVTALAERRAAIETHTDQLCAADFAVLSADERAEFTVLVRDFANHVTK